MYPDLYSEYGSFMNTDPICIRIHNIAYSNRKIFKEENVKKIVVVDPPDIFFSCGEAGAGDEPAPSEPLQEGSGLRGSAHCYCCRKGTKGNLQLQDITSFCYIAHNYCLACHDCRKGPCEIHINFNSDVENIMFRLSCHLSFF